MINFNIGDLYALLTAICWSVAVILFDISSKKMGSLQMSLIKNSIGVTGFILTIIFMRLPFPDFSNVEIILLLTSGLLGVGIADLMFLYSLKRLGSGFSAIIATIYSPAVFLFSFLMFDETISSKSYIGGFLVIFGIMISTFELPNTKNKKTIIIGISFGVLAQIFTAFSVLLTRPIMMENSILYIALYRFSAGLLFTIIFLKYKSKKNNLLINIIEGFKKQVRFGRFFFRYLFIRTILAVWF